MTSGLAAGDQHCPGLPLQGSNGDLLYPPAPGGLNGGVQAAQIHVGGDDQRAVPIDGVPDRHVQGWRLVFLLQRGPGQPGTVVRLCHDLKLHRPGIVAGEKVDRKLKTLVCTPVGDQLGIGLGVGFQLGEDILVALTGEKKSPLAARKLGGLVGESSQFICQGHFTDTGTDIVDGAD